MYSCESRCFCLAISASQERDSCNETERKIVVLTFEVKKKKNFETKN